MMVICQLYSMQLKKKWNLIQNSPVVKKRVVAPKNAVVKNDVKSKVAAKKWLWQKF